MRELCRTDPRAVKHMLALDRASNTICIKLPFYCSGDFTKAPVFGKHDHTHPIPLISLAFHDVKVQMRTDSSLGIINDPHLRIEYIYLDTKYRRACARDAHTNLLYQVQSSNVWLAPSQKACVMRLNWNHPSVRLYIAARCLKTGEYLPLSEFHLSLNGTVVMAESHRTLKQEMLETQKMYTKKNVYCIDMWRRQESINFSRIDNAVARFKLRCNPHGVKLMFALQNFNAVKYTTGMAGLLFSS